MRRSVDQLPPDDGRQTAARVRRVTDPDRLRSLPLFNVLGEDEREAIAELVDETDVPAGVDLTTQGDVAYEFFVIEHGQADVLVDGERVNELGPGDFFGEVAPLETGKRVATVRAVSAMKLVIVSGENFERLCAEHPRVGEKLQEVLRRRLAVPPS